MKSKITLSEQILNPRENRRHNQNRYPNTQILDHSLAGIGTCASIQSGAVIVLFAQISSLCEMMRSCKCFPRVSCISLMWIINKKDAELIRSHIAFHL